MVKWLQHGECLVKGSKDQKL